MDLDLFIFKTFENTSKVCPTPFVLDSKFKFKSRENKSIGHATHVQNADFFKKIKKGSQD